MTVEATTNLAGGVIAAETEMLRRERELETARAEMLAAPCERRARSRFEQAVAAVGRASVERNKAQATLLAFLASCARLV